MIGVDNAGKTTLLRLWAGIYLSSRGELYSGGRLSALLDLSVGLDASPGMTQTSLSLARVQARERLAGQNAPAPLSR